MKVRTDHISINVPVRIQYAETLQDAVNHVGTEEVTERGSRKHS
jgi:hypothetical protein